MYIIQVIFGLTISFKNKIEKISKSLKIKYLKNFSSSLIVHLMQLNYC